RRAEPMPPLGLHMTVARELAADLRSPRVDADRGAYYLGATTPDIRVLTRWDRERTHFFDLHCLDAQSGVHRLFEEQPQLRDAAALDAGTAAFVAGYISHLVLDERYITEIYRRYFGKGGVLGDEVMANVMDRLLQLHMDREQREDAEATAEIRDAPHFERMMSRHLQAAGIAGEEAIATFMEQHADELLRGTIHRIGEERIREYLSDAKAQARAPMREYLS